MHDNFRILMRKKSAVDILNKSHLYKAMFNAQYNGKEKIVTEDLDGKNIHIKINESGWYPGYY